MTALDRATADLRKAEAARDAALTRAAAEVARQFEPVIAVRRWAVKAAMEREGMRL